ncbi:uncharacterized protein LOC118197406 [Stegodyphus dumicola]|uniref:uncharacterized protein LOC118197406 n=1 Tax=Stegodyphus dumicola TaxID=202533 RepID=UPI0015A7D253|nr:uncharacterized protein LOC118197406 [Stegodyphus dumicola]
MNNITKRPLVISISIILYYFRIILAENTLEGLETYTKNVSTLMRDKESKATRDNSKMMSHRTEATQPAPAPELEASDISSEFNANSHYISFPIMSTPYLSTSVSTNDHDLQINNTGEFLIEKAPSNKNSFLMSSTKIEISSSYLLDDSSYLFRDSSYLLENSFYLLEDSNLIERPAATEVNSYSVIPSSKTIQTHIYSSFETQTHSHLKEHHSSARNEFSSEKDPVTEIHSFLSADSENSLLSFSVDEIRTFSKKPLSLVQYKTPDMTILSQASTSEKPVTDSNQERSEYLKDNKSIEVVPSSISSSLMVESHPIPFTNSISEEPEASYTTPLQKNNSQNKNTIDKLFHSDSLQEIFQTSVSSSKSESIASKLSNTAEFHEIVEDTDLLKNKSSRKEDREIDDIISGIIHLLAGNVQLVRPAPNIISTRPQQIVPVPSTRINNRGPIKSIPFSRTVVVFSQPHNHVNVATQPLPSNILPSLAGGSHHIRPSTKAGGITPTAVSVIHFYKPVTKLTPSKQGHVPFIGEIFTSENKHVHSKLPAVNENEKVVLPILTEVSKLQNEKIGGENTYSHFIFSDAADSSVVFVVSSPSSKFQPNAYMPTTDTNSNSAAKISPTKTFEVLTDATSQKTPVPFKTLTDFLSKPSEISDTDEMLPQGSIQTLSAQNLSFETDHVPVGPITDWVPIFERPSMKFKPVSISASQSPGSTISNNDVSIIVEPVMFDLTVGNSLNEIQNSEIPTTQSKSTSIQSESSSSELPRLSTSTNDGKELIVSQTITQNKLALQESSKDVSFTEGNNISHAPSTSEFNIKSQISSQMFTHELSNSYIRERTQSLKIDDDISHVSSTYYAIINTATSKNDSFLPLYEATSTLSSFFPTRSSISAPLQPSVQLPLGRPFVVPVDMEGVHPFVGAINPVGQDWPWISPTYYPGAFPSSGIQGQRPRIDINDNSRERPIQATASIKPSLTPIIRGQPRPRPNTIRIDTCIVGDDSTCDNKMNETCKTEQGISSCHCRPGFARSYTRGPCIPIVSIMFSMKVDRFKNTKISFSTKYLDRNSDEYRMMEYEARKGLSSLFSQTAFSRTFLGLTVNMFYHIGGKLIINSTVFLEEKESTRTQSVRLRLRQEIAESLKRRNQNIGDSHLSVDGSLSPLIAIEDVNECSDSNLNDCAVDAICLNVFGTFLCRCKTGYVDPFIHNERQRGRRCSACSPEYCSFHGQCFVEKEQKHCKCQGNYIGSRCEIDGEVLGVALGASLAAIIIILLTLACLCIWNRKWKQQQQKAEVLSARSYNSNQTFSYMSNIMNANANAYQLTMEDRMRWAHISDVAKNVSVQPNPELPYVSSVPPIDQSGFQARCQLPGEDEASWYDYRTRPRSRMLSHAPASSSATYYEMDSSARLPYLGSSYHSSKRFQNPGAMLRY